MRTGRWIVSVRTLSGLKPGRTRLSRQKLLRRRPEPARSTSAKESSETTKAFRIGVRPDADAKRFGRFRTLLGARAPGGFRPSPQELLAAQPGPTRLQSRESSDRDNPPARPHLRSGPQTDPDRAA